MLSFLGWLTILHFGPNSNVYPFFKFDNPDENDPYTYRLTITASLCIWTIELVSSFLARGLCWLIHKVHVTDVSQLNLKSVSTLRMLIRDSSIYKVGLSEFRNYPELVPACIITSIHVLCDMLLVCSQCLPACVIWTRTKPLMFATDLDISVLTQVKLSINNSPRCRYRLIKSTFHNSM